MCWMHFHIKHLQGQLLKYFKPCIVYICVCLQQQDVNCIHVPTCFMCNTNKTDGPLITTMLHNIGFSTGERPLSFLNQWQKLKCLKQFRPKFIPQLQTFHCIYFSSLNAPASRHWFTLPIDAFKDTSNSNVRRNVNTYIHILCHLLNGLH